MFLLSPSLQYAARPLGSYPTIESGSGAGRDPVQSLLEAYPNPQTESQKIVKMLEIIAAHVRPPPPHRRLFLVGVWCVGVSPSSR